MTWHPRLSKSRYLSGLQCPLRLWYDTYAREFAPAPDDVLQAVFDAGHEVGEVARARFPGGHLVAHDHRHVAQALEETRQLIAAGTVSAVFEAAFEHQRVLVRADVIQRLRGGAWRLVEVKSTTGLKETFIHDVAVQLWVLRGAGLDVREAAVLTLNRNYVYDGLRLDLDSLFVMHPVLDEAEVHLGRVGERVRDMLAMLAGTEAPRIAPGEHCFAPYPCGYYTHCTRDVVAPEHEVEELPWLSAERRAQLEAAGIREVRYIAPDFPLTALQRIVRRSVLSGRAEVSTGLRPALAKVTPPVRHLDFETFASAIPRFAGTRPYDPLPFLFSVHTEGAGCETAHVDYLHERDDDPRPALTDRLLEALGCEGTLCAYSGYERQVLRALAKALPQRAEALAAAEARLFDLLTVLRQNYYHPRFCGSFSLKSVLPVLVPAMGYDDLSVTDGRTAAARYTIALSCTVPAERQRTFNDLRAYCARDTLAMVALRRALATIAEATTADIDTATPTAHSWLS